MKAEIKKVVALVVAVVVAIVLVMAAVVVMIVAMMATVGLVTDRYALRLDDAYRCVYYSGFHLLTKLCIS